MRHLIAGLLTTSLLTAVLASGCTWVHMAPGASAVRVVSSAPAGCEQRGEVEVSVKSGLGPYERNALRVRLLRCAAAPAFTPRLARLSNVGL